MKIAVSSSGKNLEAQLDPRFGRCDYFLIVDTDNMDFEVFPNGNAMLAGGAGIQAAQFVASKGAQALITGRCGPNAVQMLTAAGIKLYAGQDGRIRDVVERFRQGQMTPATEANAPSHAGTGGMGGSRGMGGGRGMGMGRGGGRRGSI